MKNRDRRAYIKIINTRDTEKIVVLEVELEELDKIATSRLKNFNSCDKDVHTRALSAITIIHEVITNGNFCFWIILTKRK